MCMQRAKRNPAWCSTLAPLLTASGASWSKNLATLITPSSQRLWFALRPGTEWSNMFSTVCAAEVPSAILDSEAFMLSNKYWFWFWFLDLLEFFGIGSVWCDYSFNLCWMHESLQMHGIGSIWMVMRLACSSFIVTCLVSMGMAFSAEL